MDGDGELTAADIVALVDIMTGKITDLKALAAADLNKDGKVDITDVTILANMITSGNE